MWPSLSRIFGPSRLKLDECLGVGDCDVYMPESRGFRFDGGDAPPVETVALPGVEDLAAPGVDNLGPGVEDLFVTLSRFSSALDGVGDLAIEVLEAPAVLERPAVLLFLGLVGREGVGVVLLAGLLAVNEVQSNSTRCIGW